MNLIRIKVKPTFRKLFNLKSIHTLTLKADNIADTLQISATGIKVNNGPVININNDKILKLSEQKDNVDFFMDDVKDHIDFKVINYATLHFDFKKGELSNEVKYISKLDQKECQTLISNF